jgi:hypothetical protein
LRELCLFSWLLGEDLALISVDSSTAPKCVYSV